ncbi:pentatricopeptide repeat-containing protein At3g09040, mitochondrial [Selaginella moellendorffii]|nr:pentatricopeptide repeat-containing protein At3g09040, mitochondrial [Selaginella moellendorffii]XP_024543441.1 pentatricopeptide repeat-containing protein At3g09040, mitochondrial [Selaginella moellendorffii]XP_024543442.1 pentatricopeptide repeat-containing protein At3g09040, mitochondrial [Selaginella moellendorffii]XP_024543443.1 pentatricopeptide repeat-containing protein At3g09040, mitochondrial [Selaginella moellendorffii]XP_024543444.1 pentatricopeptide repeat-containing protein At3g|eukprot:XP_024543440.1 pentatricopeptide repeat-containing protein At3g09040, mitochondrial [Selaginella moellendorffii]
MVSRVYGKLPVGRRLPRPPSPAFDRAARDPQQQSLRSALQIDTEQYFQHPSPGPLSPAIYASLLRRCANAQALAVGRRIDAHISSYHRDPGTFLGSLLVQMYGKCGDIDSARRVFDSVGAKTAFTWNVMLAAYAQNGHYNQALDLFREMGSKHRNPEEKPNAITFSTVTNVCSLSGDLEAGRALHARILDSGVELDDFVGTCLINMYGKCGSLEDAKRLFEALPRRSVVAWNTMLGLFVQKERCEEALRFFRRMQTSETVVIPDSVSYTTALRACSLLESLEDGRSIHHDYLAGGIKPDIVLGNTLVKMYSVCGSVEESRHAFDAMPEKNSVSWTTMSVTYTQSGRHRDAMELYWSMNLEGVKSHQVVFPSVLSACWELRQGRDIHARVVAEGFDRDTVVGNALVTMYGKFGALDDARRVFHRIPEKTVISWTSMIAANAQNGEWGEAFQLFKTMKSRGGVRPNAVTCLIILDACSDFGTVGDGREIHAEIKAGGLDSQLRVNNTLVNMYGKCGSLADAREVFDSMRERNVVSWTSMLAAYTHQGHGNKALELYRTMELQGMELDDVAFVSVLSALGHAGSVHDCRQCFMTMVRDHEIQTMAEHYNCLIDLFGRAGWLDNAKDLLERMPFEPAYKEWMTYLGSCKLHGDSHRAADAARRCADLRPGVAQPFVMLLSTVGNEDDAEETESKADAL